MKRSARPLLLMCLPVVFILAIGLLAVNWRERERQAWVKTFSFSYQADIQVTRGLVPLTGSPGLFEVYSRCISKGGQGKARWLLRAQLFDVTNKKPREIWNSENKLQTNDFISFITSQPRESQAGLSPDRPIEYSDNYGWRFLRENKMDNPLKFVIEAVAVSKPLPQAERVSGGSFISEATTAQLAAARKQPGAIYIRKTLDLNARDDKKYTFK